MGNARNVALHALLRVEENLGYSNLVLDSALSHEPLSRQDKAFASVLFYGILERRITLDFQISRFSKIPLKKLSPIVLEILRMGFYQILFMEKVPESAAVNESVNLAKRNREGKSAGFINAVLRSLLRSGQRLKYPDEKKEPLTRFSVEYSCPPWMISLWQKSYGAECTLGLLKSLADQPPVYARLNNTRLREQECLETLCSEGFQPQPVDWPDHAALLGSFGAIRESAGYRAGLFHVQDLASQICCRLLDPQPGQRVIDVCAAPGGKSFTIAERMDNQGEVLSFDLYESRVGLIRKGAERLGLSIIKADVRDAASAKSEELPLADRVLCDVPCSGLGVIRRKPEIRYKLPSALDSLPDLQYLILCRNSNFVKPGGLLFYSTCTLNPAENAEVANHFAEEFRDFEPFCLKLPVKIGHAFAEPENQLTLMPHLHGSDGFFIAAFQRKQEGTR